MLLYLDTSAFLPLLIREPGSPLCRRLWREAEICTSSALLRVEAMAALGQAERMGRLSARQLRHVLAEAEELMGEMSLVQVTSELTVTAARLAVDLALRGYDAVHAASALVVVSSDSAAATGDAARLQAWSALGLTTVDTRA